MPNTLLLQGPVGPFFAGLADELQRRGDTVRHVVFNGGDRLFAKRSIRVDYTGHPEEVGPWVIDRCREWQIDRVVLFGDCRPYHRAIHQLLNKAHIPVWVFEEGYLRPFFLTFERHGVNAHTLLPRDPSFYLDGPEMPAMPPLRSFKRIFSRRIVTCMAYYIAMAMHRSRYRHYRHYRCDGLFREGLQWQQAGWRKLLYKRPDQRRRKQFIDHTFYLLPLQVRGDSQIGTHSGYHGMEQVIARSIAAFSNGAPTDSHLVIKHHPMDRGYTNYRKLITNLAERFGVSNRVWYVHDLNLPELMIKCRGVITVNSTVGLSALHHRKPVMVLGDAMYDIEGICYRGSWKNFWTTDFLPDRKLVRRFVDYLRYWTQMNACSATNEANFALLDRLPEFRVRAATQKMPTFDPATLQPTLAPQRVRTATTIASEPVVDAPAATTTVVPATVQLAGSTSRRGTTQPPSTTQEIAFAG